MPPLTRQEQRDREEFINRYMRENPDADDVEAEDLWEDRRSGDGADGVDDGPDEPLPQSEAQPVRDEGANEPTAPAAPTSPSAPPTGGPESAPTPKPMICLLVLGFSYALGGAAYAFGYNPLGINQQNLEGISLAGVGLAIASLAWSLRDK